MIFSPFYSDLYGHFGPQLSVITLIHTHLIFAVLMGNISLLKLREFICSSLYIMAQNSVAHVMFNQLAQIEHVLV